MPDEMRPDPKTFPKVIRTGEPGGKGQKEEGKRHGVLFVAQTRELPCTNRTTRSSDFRLKRTCQMVQHRLTLPFLQCGLGRTGNTVFKIQRKSSIIRMNDQSTISWNEANTVLQMIFVERIKKKRLQTSNDTGPPQADKHQYVYFLSLCWDKFCVFYNTSERQARFLNF